MTARAKVILKKSMTHITGGRRWIKDVPHIIVGDDAVKAFEENGFFHNFQFHKFGVNHEKTDYLLW